MGAVAGDISRGEEAGVSAGRGEWREVGGKPHGSFHTGERGKQSFVAVPTRPRHIAAMDHGQVRVEARIHFLSTAEGGRSSALQGGSSYRPNHNFFGPDDREMCMGSIELAEGEQVAPGDTIVKAITLWIYPAVEPEIRQGREWRIQEGGKLVATATILSVLEPQ